MKLACLILASEESAPTFPDVDGEAVSASVGGFSVECGQLVLFFGDPTIAGLPVVPFNPKRGTIKRGTTPN